MLFLLLLLLVVCGGGGGVEGVGDPSPVLFPGQVNIGLLADIHAECGGPLRPHAVQRAMAAVWAAHQANYGDPQAPNIGVYIYDTCGREEVAQRQAYRLLAANDCPTSTTSSSKTPPIAAVIVEGDTESVRVPLKLFSAFSLPVITATGTPDIAAGILSTAPSTPALARGGVSVLHHLRLLEVAVVAEEEDALFAHFSAQVAHVTGMQATLHVQEGGGDNNNATATAATDDAELQATLQLISRSPGKVKAVVFLVSCEEAVSLLQAVNERPQIPWLVITPGDISARLTTTQGRKLNKVLLLSPESSPSSAFSEYFKQLLQEEDTIKYHPLLQEYAASNDTTPHDSDVSGVSRAVWAVSSSLAEVRRSCRRGGGSCSSELGRTLLEQGGFDQEGALSSLRYALKGFTVEGVVTELGFYSDDEGLNVEPGALQSFREPPPPPPPATDSRWKIFEDSSSSSSTQNPLEMKKDDLLMTHKEVEADLQSVSGKEVEEEEVKRISSNMISRTSHHETEKHEESVVRSSSVPLSAWLGRPWSLGVLGTSCVLSLVSLYALVFVLVRACEGGGGGGSWWLPVVQLVSLVAVCGAAALYTWRPAPVACGLKRALHNSGLVFCYAGLLLKGMCVRGESSLGLGGSVNRCNLLLTLVFAVGVQVALEWQWWLLHTPSIQQRGGGECRKEILASQIYAAILLLMATVIALSTKRLPSYCRRESRRLIGTTLACCLVFGCWGVACWLLPSSLVAAPVSLLATALTVLLGLLLPHVYALHTGSSPLHKPLLNAPSYADSLSTVFTMFNNSSTLTTTAGGGRGKKKTLDYQDP